MMRSQEAKTPVIDLSTSAPQDTFVPGGSSDWRKEPIICWTRMQSEAGQGLAHIIARKDAERCANAGTFFWGVGNPPPLALASLVHKKKSVPMLFSIMKSRPKIQDSAPERVFAWRRFIDSAGITRPMPDSVLVTSRATARSYHYALVCYSKRPILLDDLGPFNPAAYRNFGGTGAPIGNSQVTALLQRCNQLIGGDYRIAMVTALHRDLWVKLVDPIELTKVECSALNAVKGDSPAMWSRFVSSLRLTSRPAAYVGTVDQPTLFMV